VPFRKAHHTVGAVVGLAERANKPLNELTPAELQSVDKNFGADAPAVFDLEKAMAQRKMTGAPSPKEVKKQLARWRKMFANPD
jgi:argininosuccinate lyase